MNVNTITFRAVEKRNSIINPHFLNKKLNIKDIALDKILVKTLEVHKYFRVKGSP